MCQNKDEDMSSYKEGQVHQLMDRLEKEGFTSEHITKLGQMENLQSIRDVLDGLAQIITVKFLQVVKQGLQIPSLTTPFIVKDNFVNGKGIKFYFGGNFKNWFMGQTVESHNATALNSWLLTKNLLDNAVLKGLGDNCETTLDVVYALIKNQPNGEEGVLLNNGKSNIFYIKDVSGVLRAVHVYLDGAVWCVGAIFVLNPSVWYEGLQVFSRNSVI